MSGVRWCLGLGIFAFSTASGAAAMAWCGSCLEPFGAVTFANFTGVSTVQKKHVLFFWLHNDRVARLDESAKTYLMSPWLTRRW